MENIKLQELQELQFKLDTMVLAKNGKVDVFEETKLAFMVELGELANEIQSFKHWKVNKNINQERILDEWADCLHFALSLDNQRDYKLDSFLKSEGFKLDDSFINFLLMELFQKVTTKEPLAPYVMRLGIHLGFDTDKLKGAYLSKNKVNIERQNNGY